MDHTPSGAGKAAGGHGNAPVDRAGIVYVCPMHPEVQSPEPGRCPKCGMGSGNNVGSGGTFAGRNGQPSIESGRPCDGNAVRSAR